MVGFGWYMWETEGSGSDKATPPPVNTKISPSKSTANQGMSSGSTVAGQDYLVIGLNPTLGFKAAKIKVMLPANIRDAYYYTGSGGTVLSAHSLDSIPGCQANYYLQGAALLAYDLGKGDKSEFKSNPDAVKLGQDWVAISTKHTDSCSSSNPATQGKINAVKQAFVSASKTITETK